MDKKLDKDFDLIIRAGSSSKNYWLDIWNFRELFFFLSWRDILVRYKQTIIGISWSVIRPLLSMIVFTVIFGTFANMPSEGAPYPILVYSAMLPWMFFATSLSESSNSMVGNKNLVAKVYFPRIFIPMSSVIVSFVDFLISVCILIVIMVWYKFVPGWQIVFLPLFFSIAVVTAIGAGLLFSALNVKYRDFRYIVPFIVQFGMYISPVGFSSEIVPDKWRFLYSLNPMVGVIEGFRWAIIGGEAEIYWPGLILSIVLTLILFIVGYGTFRRMERTFADFI